MANRGEVITGEHSGLANARPGNPGTIDPPAFADIEPLPTGGAIAGGTYDYALTARSPAGETVASVVPGVAVGAAGSTTNAATLSFPAVCHAIGYDVYRRPAGTAAWARVATLARAADAPTDDGSDPIALRDHRHRGGRHRRRAAHAPTAPRSRPTAQNPNCCGPRAGRHADASRRSTTDAIQAASPPAPFQGAMRAVPRYPSNVYYNVSRQGQQLDEYNWIYVLPANGGGCVPIAGVTTCRTTPATWSEYVTSETRVMFRHLAGNDPRPHFFHQSNLADYNPALPGPIPTRAGSSTRSSARSWTATRRPSSARTAPLLQLTPTEIAATLARQEAWAAARATVSAWVQDGRVYVRNAGAAPVVGPAHRDHGRRPLRRPALRVDLGPGGGPGRRSRPADPAATAAPAITGRPVVGETLKTTDGAWTGTPQIGFARRWQRCTRSQVRDRRAPAPATS